MEYKDFKTILWAIKTIVLHSLFTCTPRTPKTEFYVKQGQIYGKILCFG